MFYCHGTLLVPNYPVALRFLNIIFKRIKRKKTLPLPHHKPLLLLSFSLNNRKQVLITILFSPSPLSFLKFGLLADGKQTSLSGRVTIRRKQLYLHARKMSINLSVTVTHHQQKIVHNGHEFFHFVSTLYPIRLCKY